MSTGYILNMFGHYEERGGSTGIALKYAGIEFWLPYRQVTPIPNWTFREVDHPASHPQGDMIVTEVSYLNVIVNGQRVVEELCDKQIPVPCKDMGIMSIQGKPTGRMITVISGCSAEGIAITSEVQEREPTKPELELAEKNSSDYKKMVIAEYFQSKRERMTGGRGQLHPIGIVRTFMEEMNVEDMDDVTAHSKHAGMDAAMIGNIVKTAIEGTSQAMADNLKNGIDSVRRGTKAQLTDRPARENIGAGDARKAERDAALSPEERERRAEIGRRLVEGRAKKQAERAAAEAELAAKG